MQLNIYNISHPIIQLLSNSITNANISSYSSQTCDRYLGFLIIYEILRKYVTIKKLYIKLINYTKQLYLLDIDTKYILLTNIEATYNMLIDIQNLIPNIEIINIEIEHKNFNHTIENLKNKYSDSTKVYIFFLEKIINNEKIIKTLRYLEKYIDLNQINIICISIQENILHKLAIIYPKLKIYTTEII
uniref:Uracil phosphoribosyltransferase n=1 Tax=Lophocladia kuetzingii TaxID=675577 RepID=A0A1Z1MNU3_9FLOR|nr:uracil phosphoribosyltransferase [Lophocladia kuetzingii]ARW67760.1 uracil phosphoribosyltransferase [Lophocladia kuetzingii]